METATPCVSCGRPMQPLRLAGHFGREVEVEVCAGCHLLWFDGVESVNLTGRGVLDLLRVIAAAHAQPHRPLAARLACPRCGSALKRAANITTLGPTAQHECPRGHGAAQSFSLYLAEKGFVRAVYRPELVQLQRAPDERRVFTCINCGAPLDPRQREACGHCGSPLKMVDVLPLLRAIDRQTGHLAPGPKVSAGLVPRSFACAHCGAAVDPTRERRCPACTMPIAITDLHAALAVMEPLAAAVESGAVNPQHRLRRLDEIDAAALKLPPSRPPFGYRQRLWVYLASCLVMAVVGAVIVRSAWKSWL